jgi:hypothetical protein
MLGLALSNHVDSPLLILRGKLRYSAHDSILSRNGASGKSGAVQMVEKRTTAPLFGSMS